MGMQANVLAVRDVCQDIIIGMIRSGSKTFLHIPHMTGEEASDVLNFVLKV